MEKQMDETQLIPDSPEAEELRKLLNKQKAEEEKRLHREQVEKEQASYEYRVQALIETALAYWRRGAALQYESGELVNVHSRDGEIGSRRCTDYISPEDATLDLPGYTVCSTLPFNLLYDLLDYTLGMNPDTCRCADHFDLENEAIVYRWEEGHGETLEEAARIARQILRPGDILTAKRATAHAMLFLGDCFGDGTEYMLHSWGAKYNMNTGKDSYEPMGTMRLQPVDELAFVQGDRERYRANKIPRFSLYDDQFCFVIVRPLRACREEQWPLTANAKARMAHPGLNIDRTASVKPYQTARIGDSITYWVTVENCSKTAYTDITVFEPIPAGTKLAAAPDAWEQEDGLHWTLSVGAGEKKTVTFTVQITQGPWVIAQGGNVAGIRSNKIRTHVGNRLTEEQEAKLLTQADKGISQAYASIGIDVDLEKLVCSYFEPYPGREKLIRRQKDTPMLVPLYMGGRWLITKHTNGRILEFGTYQLHVGDVLLHVTEPLEKDQSITAYMYLGGEEFLVQTPEGISKTTEEVLWPSFTKDLFFCVRPSLTA